MAKKLTATERIDKDIEQGFDYPKRDLKTEPWTEKELEYFKKIGIPSTPPIDKSKLP